MANVCTIDANPDIYGVGIRLGFYMSWVSSQIAFMLNQENTISDVYDASIVLNSAMMIAILFVTVTAAQAHPIEIIIMLYLSSGNSLFIKEPSVETGWRAFINNTSDLGLAIYGAWFWIKGIFSATFLSSVRECKPIVFFVGRIPGADFHAIRIVFIVIYIVSCIGVSGLICDELRRVLKRIWFIPASDRTWANILTLEFSECTKMRYEDADGLRDKLYARAYVETRDGMSSTWFGRILAHYSLEFMAWLETSRRMESVKHGEELQLDIELSEEETKVWKRYRRNKRLRQSISRLFAASLLGIGIELMLLWNNIDGVYHLASVGQLIPFTIGIFGFMKVFADAIHGRNADSSRLGGRNTAGSESILELIAPKSESSKQ